MINKETAALQKIFEERRKRIAAINKMAWFEDCQREWALAQDIVEPEDASSGGQEQSSGPSSALPPSSVSTPDSTEPSLVADDPPARPTTHAYFTRSKSAPSKITPPNLSQPRIAQGQDHQMEETYADSDGYSSEDMSDDSDSSIKDALAKEWRKYYQSEEYQSRALVYYVEPGAYDPDFPQSLPYSPTHPSTPSPVSTSTKPTSITTTTPVTTSKQQPAIRVTNGKAKTTNHSSGAPGASRRSDGSGKSPAMLRSMRNKHSGRKSPPPPTLPPLSSTSSSSSSNTSGQSNYDDNNSNHDRNDDNTSSHDSDDNSDASGEGSIDGNNNHSSHPPPHSQGTAETGNRTCLCAYCVREHHEMGSTDSGERSLGSDRSRHQGHKVGLQSTDGRTRSWSIAESMAIYGIAEYLGLEGQWSRVCVALGLEDRSDVRHSIESEYNRLRLFKDSGGLADLQSRSKRKRARLDPAADGPLLDQEGVSSGTGDASVGPAAHLDSDGLEDSSSPGRAPTHSLIGGLEEMNEGSADVSRSTSASTAQQDARPSIQGSPAMSPTSQQIVTLARANIGYLSAQEASTLEDDVEGSCNKHC